MVGSLQPSSPIRPITPLHLPNQTILAVLLKSWWAAHCRDLECIASQSIIGASKPDITADRMLTKSTALQEKWNISLDWPSLSSLPFGAVRLKGELNSTHWNCYCGCVVYFIFYLYSHSSGYTHIRPLSPLHLFHHLGISMVGNAFW